MKSETPTEAARRICPHWMLPINNAHYRDVLAALQNQRRLGMSSDAHKLTDDDQRAVLHGNVIERSDKFYDY